MDVSFDIYLAILVFFVFIICIFLLNKWFYIPILNFMDSRDAMLKKDLEVIANNNNEINKINDEIKDILKKAKKDSELIKENAILNATNMSNKRLLEAREANEKEFIVFMNSLSVDKEELKNSLLLRLPSFKADLLKKLKNN